MSFIRRRIDVTITLGDGEFGNNLGDTVTLTGLRVMANIASVGGEAQGQCQARIFGLPLSMINRLTTIGPAGMAIRGQNGIEIAAGNEGDALSTVFKGSIFYAYGELAQAPEVALSVYGLSAALASVKPVGATSYVGAVDVATVMAGFAQEMGFTLEGNGVSVMLQNPYFPGPDTLSKVRQAAQAARIGFCVDNGVLAIWPQNGYRTGDVPIISPGAGLVSYPTFNEQYISVRTVFLPSAVLGGRFTVAKSAVTPANGTWNTASVVHNLESQVPNGQWFTDLQGWGNG